MVRATFRIRSDAADFRISGHAGAGVEGEDIVCAAVSSAAYLAANTISEILGVGIDAEVKDGSMRISFSGSKAGADIARGLLLHLQQLQAQYPDNVKVSTEE